MSLRDPLDKWTKFNSFISFVNLIVVGLILAMVVISMAGCDRSQAKESAPSPAPDNLRMHSVEVWDRGVFSTVYRTENVEAICYVLIGADGRGGVSCLRK